MKRLTSGVEESPLVTLSVAVCVQCHSHRGLGNILIGCLLAGARQIATGLSIAKDTNQKIFVTSMCIGSGMGMAALFVSEQN